tara:strand:+ start:1329 stop:1592 length:264 start_codon:yes stop_codon:yes gene_type:complete
MREFGDDHLTDQKVKLYRVISTLFDAIIDEQLPDNLSRWDGITKLPWKQDDFDRADWVVQCNGIRKEARSVLKDVLNEVTEEYKYLG